MTLADLQSALSFVLFTYNDVQITVLKVIQVPLVLFLMWFVVTWIGRLIKKALLAKNLGPDTVHLFTRIYLVVTIAVLVFTSLEVLNIPLTAFAFVSGAIAIGVGFGAQNIINNFISGWILMWERPIRIGDFLEVGTAKGVVETINTRSTSTTSEPYATPTFTNERALRSIKVQLVTVFSNNWLFGTSICTPSL
ncbi:MAG: mechanosensitive ion channel domain-containing protein, partial [Pseudomonadota bacterium]